MVKSKPIISLEDSELKNMLRKVEPKLGTNGHQILKNNAQAKIGIERSSTNVALGIVGVLVAYRDVFEVSQERAMFVAEELPLNEIKLC